MAIYSWSFLPKQTETANTYFPANFLEFWMKLFFTQNNWDKWWRRNYENKVVVYVNVDQMLLSLKYIIQDYSFLSPVSIVLFCHVYTKKK